MISCINAHNIDKWKEKDKKLQASKWLSSGQLVFYFKNMEIKGFTKRLVI